MPWAPRGGHGLYATLMLWKKSGEKWTDAELVPVKQVSADATGGVSVSFADGSSKTITFDSTPNATK